MLHRRKRFQMNPSEDFLSHPLCHVTIHFRFPKPSQWWGQAGHPGLFRAGLRPCAKAKHRPLSTLLRNTPRPSHKHRVFPPASQHRIHSSANQLIFWSQQQRICTTLGILQCMCKYFLRLYYLQTIVSKSNQSVSFSMMGSKAATVFGTYRISVTFAFCPLYTKQNPQLDQQSRSTHFSANYWKS